MKEEEKKHIPNIKKQGWSAREIIEQGSNEEPDDVLEKIIQGDNSKRNAENRSLIDILFPPNGAKNSSRPERRKSVSTSNTVNSDGESQ